jgi:hypothetical protein
MGTFFIYMYDHLLADFEVASGIRICCVRSCVIYFFLLGICFIDPPGPEEEKLLGSILLPSYKISPCSTEDRVYRKFAFKAEHTNMRTYYFAADTRELMVQWMNALSLASILQEGSRYRRVGVTILIIV